MALLLIMAENHQHLDPVKDARGSYKRGDIVDVYEDDRHDGDFAANPIAAPFVLVRVSGLSVEQARAYIASDRVQRIDPVHGFVLDTRTRRLFRLRVDDLPASVRQALVQDRYYATTFAAVRTFIRDKVTGVDQ